MGGQRQRNLTPVFAIQHQDTPDMDTMVDTLSINLHSAYVLFDTGATFSCVAESFVSMCGLFAEFMSVCHL